MLTVKLDELRTGVTTEQPDNILEVVSTESLAVGKHTFSLVVTDAAGNTSQAATVTIAVLDRTAPTAVLTLLDANRQPTNTVEWGAPFFLSAEGSADTPSAELGGEIVKFIWTLEGAN